MVTGTNQEIVLEETSSLFIDWIPDIIGCFGTIIVLMAYLLLQSRKLNSHSILFSVLNLIGGLLILVSLFYCWNLAAVAMEVSWVTISSYGLLRVLFPKAQDHANAQT